MHSIHWAIPLPDPIGVPEGPWRLDVPIAGQSVVVEARVVQGEVPGTSLGELLFACLGVEKQDNAPASEITAPVTVLVVAIPAPVEELNEGLYSELFDLALTIGRDIQRAYYVAAQRPVTLVTRETLPPVIPVVVREDDGSEVSVGVFLTGVAAMERITLPQEIEGDRLAAFRASLEEPTRVFFAYADLRREALAALHLRGEMRTAAIMSATASEVLLDTLLLHLSWGAGVEPAEAAQLFLNARAGVRARVPSAYGPRLGGEWAYKTVPELAEWRDGTMALRDRVVHAGIEPTLEQARRSVDALLALERLMGDRVAESVGRGQAIRTAWAFIGIPGLTRRGRLTTRARTVIDRNSSSWTAEFVAWREDALRLVDAS